MIDVALKANAAQRQPALMDRKLSGSEWKRLKRAVVSVKKKGARMEQLQAAREAVAALGTSGDARAANLLREHYRSAPRELIGPINRALGELRDPQAFDLMLGELIAQGPALEPGVLQGLGQLGIHHAVRPLMMFGSVFPAHRVRVIDAVVSLGEAGIPSLISLLEESRDEAIQLAVIESLGRLKDRRAVETLQPFVQHPKATFRCQTAEALGQIADKRSLQILCTILEDPSENVRLAAATSLAKMPDARIARPMLRALEDKSADIRILAIQTLGACKEPKVLPRLAVFLDSENEEERISAAEAMGRLGSTDAIPKLLAVLEATNPEDVQGIVRIVDAFRRLEDARATLPLLNQLENRHKLVRLRATEALGKIGDRSARELLEGALSSDPADDVRVAAARALGEIGDPASVYALEKALRGSMPLRTQALIAIGALKTPTSLRAVLDVIDDPAESVRYHAANVLGELGGDEALQALEKLTGDDAEIVRRAAFKSLEALGDARPEKEIQRAQRRREAGPKTPMAGRLMSVLPSSLIGIVHQSKMVWAMVAASILGMAALGLLVWAGVGFWNSKPAPIPLRGDVAGISFSPDGKLLAVGRTRGMLEVWNLQEQRVDQRIKDVPSAQVGFCGDSRTVVLTSGGTAQLVSLDDPSRPTPLEGHENGIVSISFTPDRKHLATFDSDGLVVVWDVAAKSGQTSLQFQGKAINAIALSPDASRVAAANRAGDVELWNVSSPDEPPRVLRGGGESLTHVAFSVDGSHVAAATQKGRIVVWPADQPRPLRVFDGSNILLPQSLDFIDLNNLFVSRATSIEHLDAEAGTSRTFDLTGEIEGITTLAVSTNGGTAAVGYQENTQVCLVDLKTGEITAVLDVP